MSRLRAGLKGQVHAVLGKEGVIPHLVDLWGPAGGRFLDDTRLGVAYQQRVTSLRDLIVVYDTWLGIRLDVSVILRCMPRFGQQEDANEWADAGSRCVAGP